MRDYRKTRKRKITCNFTNHVNNMVLFSFLNAKITLIAGSIYLSHFNVFSEMAMCRKIIRAQQILVPSSFGKSQNE